MPEGPNPEIIWNTFNAYQRTAALRAAIELDVFTAIGKEPASVETIAERCQASPRGVRVLSDYLTVIGLLEKAAGRYRLTPASAAFLDKRSPAYLGTVVKFVNDPQVMRAFDDVANVVRRGSTLLGSEGLVKSENPQWVEFARSMAPLVAPAAEFLAELAARGGGGSLKVLDVAAGHGLFGIAVARKCPQAEVVALDWPNVLQVAEENAKAAGVKPRFRLLPGDAFQVELGRGFDLVLLTNILHHFDAAGCGKLLRKVRDCLKPGGRAITLEFVPEEDRVSPPIPAAFAFTMLCSTPGGDAYTFKEYEGMFRAAGFGRSELFQVPRSPQQAIVSENPAG